MVPKWVRAFRQLEPAAMRLVKRILEGETKATPREQLEAAKLALAYARGKPRESVEITGKHGGPIQTVAVLGDAAHAAQVLEHLAGVGALPPPTPDDAP